MPAPKTPGIYRITHEESGHVYIGGTVNIRRRWAEHRSYLGRSIHWIAAMQALFDRGGFASLKFEIVEHVESPSSVLEREQFWLDSGLQTLNFSPTAGSCAGTVRGPLSDAHKEKLSAAKKGKPLADWHRKLLADINRNRTPEHCANISAGKLGKRPSEAARANMSAAKLGTKASDETRRAISAALKGKPKSDAHKASLRKPKSEAHKAALSEARKKWWAEKKATTSPPSR